MNYQLAAAHRYTTIIYIYSKDRSGMNTADFISTVIKSDLSNNE
jgi:hypothetical protein